MLSKEIYSEADTFSQVEYHRQYQLLQNRANALQMESLLAGHPCWSIAEGQTALDMMLYRNWRFSRSAAENRQQFLHFTKELEQDFIPSDAAYWSEALVSQTMQIADHTYDLTHSVFQGRHFFIFLLPAMHRTEDSFCRCLQTEEGSCGDIYLTIPHDPTPATPQSILLHELGHCVHMALTGGLQCLPPGFPAAFSCFPTLVEKPANFTAEILAHCFAMSVLIDPALQAYDPFSMIDLQDKQLFQRYFMNLLASPARCPKAEIPLR